ncbi:ABC transporter ATP-binding protein [Paramaledivibacter caminithermalis]|nr:ABC transporter ATP-binding protein [Paramaledivibacter caminithermalis]
MYNDLLLNIENLDVCYKISDGIVKAVKDVSFYLRKGEVLGLVGESGCGKTTLIKAILKLLPSNGYIANGEIYFKDREITKMDNEQLRRIRWNEISMITQSAMNALDPVYKVGDQIVEAILTHKAVSKKEAYSRAMELFNLVGLEKGRLNDFPHQFSGGMKQRAIIAMALALNPEIIIADEPTTALDVVVQAQILERINTLLAGYDGSMIMVTHDISVIAQTCHRIVVMYGGRVMEFGNAIEVLKEPNHPYSMGLKNAFPSITGEKRNLISIPGTPPNLLKPPKGCRFNERCPFALEKCFHEEPMLQGTKGGYVACHRFYEAEDLRAEAGKEETWMKIRKRRVMV